MNYLVRNTPDLFQLCLNGLREFVISLKKRSLELLLKQSTRLQSAAVCCVLVTRYRIF